MKLKRRNLFALSLLTITAATPASAAADQTPPATSKDGVTTGVKRLPEISLDGHKGADSEQWGPALGMTGVRNVAHATLTPFLPPANLATGAAVIVIPGGAFYYVSMDNEGYDVAQWLASRGIAAFVLKYRVNPSPRDVKVFENMAMEMMKQVSGPNAPVINITTPPGAIVDALSALKLVRSQAPSFGVDPQRVGVLGFSAGGQLAMDVGLTADVADRPAFIGDVYGPMDARKVPADAPPLFMALALDDPLGARGQLGLMNSWRAAKRPVAAHFYEVGGHGFGMNSKGAATALWSDEMYAWLKDRGLLTSTGRR